VIPAVYALWQKRRLGLGSDPRQEAAA